ncbi:GtrA family protein [Kaistia algarum]|uniref:GtrA family protein n=1 Tax=Kaistia algarum TaxID=2083279 RepID=UPI0010574E72|nr:GtrA family protein [Kaistia algarum]MCX5516109.1 GtrA family protein [Kaistia algarum]
MAPKGRRTPVKARPDYWSWFESRTRLFIQESRTIVASNLPTGQFAGFVSIGIASAGLSLLARYAANQILPFEASVVVAHIVGMIFSFALNRLLIFPETQRSVWDELARFTLVNLMSLAIATGMSSWFYRIVLPALDIQAYSGVIAHLAGLGACTVPSFLGHKFFSFRQQETRPAAPPSIRAKW